MAAGQGQIGGRRERKSGGGGSVIEQEEDPLKQQKEELMKVTCIRIYIVTEDKLVLQYNVHTHTYMYVCVHMLMNVKAVVSFITQLITKCIYMYDTCLILVDTHTYVDLM